MDIISFNEASTANGRIENFIKNPDSTSGIVTVPSTIASGETITIPAGRTAILPDVQIDGTLNVQGNVFIPTGTKTSKVIPRVTSTDNAIVRFDGTTGAVQNSTVIVDDNGNVGIGVTPSNWGSSYKTIGVEYYGNVSSTQTDASINISSNTYFNGTNWVYKETGVTPTLYKAGSGIGYSWQTAPSGTAGNAITWTNAMSLDASGNLIVGQNNTIVTINARYNATGSQTSIVARGTSSTDEVFQATINGVLKSAILANGTYQSATNVYGSTSDIKLKENVVDTTPKLEKLMQVQVKNFNYIGQEDSKQIGVIAQEIETIFPSVVFETKDTKQVEVTKERVVPAVEEVKDEEGNVITEAKPESIEEYIETETQETGEVTKNVKYSVLYMIAIKALQELNAKVEAMQLEINELKGAK